ncbi:hypothetical protein RRG08_056459 [Elysia crispata]|uniref:Uncharacterized protein n=1 Tax=Elysia crispata TaxID=231223 RepID=A0AAE1DDB4_9GAST|nr:hypothetical protein RRG08_056459 [Elysia crispata]
MPDIVQAPGLSVQRQAYLYKEIRPLVAEDKRDIVTPLPSETVPEEIVMVKMRRQYLFHLNEPKKIPEHKIKGVDVWTRYCQYHTSTMTPTRL